MRSGKCRSEKYRSNNIRKAVKTENSKILGVSARTKQSQMVFEQ